MIRSLPFTFVVVALICNLSTAQNPRKFWTTSKLKGTPTPPPKFAIKPAFPNLVFTKPTSIEAISGNQFLVAEIGGKVYTFDRSNSNTKSKNEVLNLTGAALWHATVHPNFEKDSLLFACYSKDGTTHVSSFKASGSPLKADLKSETVILTWPAGGHNGGCLSFGKDGMLYISTGDGSGPNPPDGRTAGQDVSNLFGCILRIDVNKKSNGKNYSIPKDNPFRELKDARAEIWAYGLRNPWKFGVDKLTGRVFAADNGWETWEMVHEIVRGGNCGWPIMEGRAVLRGEVKPGPTPIIPPIKDHHHSEANSVIGGPVYRGSKLADLEGYFVYGDYITGTIWGVKAGKSGKHEFQTLLDTDLRIIAFVQSADERLFVVDYDYTGQIYEIVESKLKDRSQEFPRVLSETGIFKSLETMEPVDGVMAYDVNVKRWTDGLASRRWVGIPGKGTIDLRNNESPAQYPDGTVFVKHLWMPKSDSASKNIPVETQVLHRENGSWNPYTYFWNNAFDDKSKPEAKLVDSRGGNFDIYLNPKKGGGFVTQKWHVSAVNECRLCHNAGSDFVLGFQANQLDRSVFRSPNDYHVSQVEQLFKERIISSKPEFPKGHPERLVDPHNPSFSLDDRARSYLHGNCSSCHHPGGNAIVSFYLKRDLPFDKLRTNKGTGIGTFGMQNAKVIVPGDPYRSVLFYRMMKLGYARMPYIGSYKTDSQGVALIEEWIKKMPHQKSELDSNLVNPESDLSKTLAKIESNKNSPIAANNPSIQKLIATTEGSLALSASIHAGRAQSIDSVGVYKTTESDIRGLFETFVPVALRRKTLGNAPDPESILSLTGISARGQLIFQSDNARCANCHHPKESEKSVGPTLEEIRKKYKSKEEMLKHILNPDLAIDEKFATWLINTDEGKTHTGLLIQQTNELVSIKTSEGKVITLTKASVENLKKSKQSIMPKNIFADFTAQEAADLLEWFAGEK